MTSLPCHGSLVQGMASDQSQADKSKSLGILKLKLKEMSQHLAGYTWI